MKFRDPKTGEVFDPEHEGAPNGFCAHIVFCSNCPIPKCAKERGCSNWIIANPAEAARRMGYEVVEDSATGKTQGGKSLFCELIGVVPGQPFLVHGYPYRAYPPMAYEEDGCVRLYSPDGQKRHKVGGRAITWIVDHPESVEPCEGYTLQEVAFKKEEPMEEKDKPRICRVLGVEINEEWRVTGSDMATYRINEDGEFEYAMPLYSRPGHGEWRDDEKAHLLYFINHPDRILRKPRFTQEEAEIAKGLQRVWPDGKLLRRTPDDLVLTSYHYGLAMPVPADMFPSLRPGQAVKLEEVIGAAP